MRNKTNRSAQSALDFLTTYGWAIAAAVVAIGAIFYFGVVNTDNLKPIGCQVTPGVICDEFLVKESEGVQIVLTNKLPSSMHSVSVVEVTSVDIGENRIVEESAEEDDKHINRPVDPAIPATPGDPTNPATPAQKKNVSSPQAPEVLTCSIPSGTDYPTDGEILINCSDKFSNLKGSKIKVEFKISYVLGDNKYPQIIAGQVMARVQ